MSLNLRSDGFDWDDGNCEKCVKHGVSVASIEDLFSRTVAIVADPTAGEERFRAVGQTAAGRSVLLVFTWRERNGLRLIRPISARYMHKREILAYEEEIRAAQQ